MHQDAPSVILLIMNGTATTKSLTVRITSKRSVSVASFAEARDVVFAAWAAAGKGSGAYYRDPAAGIIEDAAGNRIAHVSYNGRVWRGSDRFALGQEEIRVD